MTNCPTFWKIVWLWDAWGYDPRFFVDSIIKCKGFYYFEAYSRGREELLITIKVGSNPIFPLQPTPALSETKTNRYCMMQHKLIASELIQTLSDGVPPASPSAKDAELVCLEEWVRPPADHSTDGTRCSVPDWRVCKIQVSLCLGIAPTYDLYNILLSGAFQPYQIDGSKYECWKSDQRHTSGPENYCQVEIRK